MPLKSRTYEDPPEGFGTRTVLGFGRPICPKCASDYIILVSPLEGMDLFGNLEYDANGVLHFGWTTRYNVAPTEKLKLQCENCRHWWIYHGVLNRERALGEERESSISKMRAQKNKVNGMGKITE